MNQKRRPVCIYGASHGYRMPINRRAPLYKAAVAGNAELWTCNGLIWDVDIMFEIHRRSYLKTVYGEEFARYEKQLLNYTTGATNAYLQAQSSKNRVVERPLLVTAHPWPTIHSVTYPETLIRGIAQFGAWHCGSFDYMLAYALLKGYTDIRLYNINFTRGGEPLGAPACLAYWVGVANGRGATVRLFNCDTIGKTYQLLESRRQYGLEDMVLVEGTKKKASLNWPGLA